MAEKEIKLLGDPMVKPDSVIVATITGSQVHLWNEIMEYMKSNYPGSEGGWHYYNDGKQWLFKMVLKKKTVFWASLVEGSFNITFYFGDKAEQSIISSNLSDGVKQSFVKGQRFGKIRGITFNAVDTLERSDIFRTIDLRVKTK